VLRRECRDHGGIFLVEVQRENPIGVSRSFTHATVHCLDACFGGFILETHFTVLASCSELSAISPIVHTEGVVVLLERMYRLAAARVPVSDQAI